MKVKRILVPLDGSVLAETVLPRASEVARASGATVELLTAVEAHTLPGVDPVEAQVKAVQAGEQYVGAVAERLRGEGAGEVVTSVWYGPAAYAIVDAARLHKVDLIVMATHGRSGLGRLIMGSVAESVLRGTTTPILLLRAAEAPVEPPKGKGEPVTAPRVR